MATGTIIDIAQGGDRRAAWVKAKSLHGAARRSWLAKRIEDPTESTDASAPETVPSLFDAEPV